MTKFNRFYGYLIFTSLFMFNASTAQADMQQQTYGTPVVEKRTYMLPPKHLTYSEKVGNKAIIAFANLTTSTLEIPKNIINTMNQSNFFYGVAGGFLKGLVNTLGRTGCGIADLITLPLPTIPVAYPLFIWDDFDEDTYYGDVFRLDTDQQSEQPVIHTPVPQPAATTKAIPPKPAVVYPSN